VTGSQILSGGIAGRSGPPLGAPTALGRARRLTGRCVVRSRLAPRGQPPPASSAARVRRFRRLSRSSCRECPQGSPLECGSGGAQHPGDSPGIARTTRSTCR